MPWDEWIRTVELEPSLYAADFSRLGEQVDVLVRAGVRVFHFDVGDGRFVPAITMGPVVLQSIAKLVHDAGCVVDVHLMIERPERQLDAFRAAGGDSVTFHYEACDDHAGVAEEARAAGFEGVGLAFNPETLPEDAAAAASSGFDLV